MREAQVRSGMIVGLFLFVAMTGTGSAEQGFDEKYQRDFNIFNPINEYQPGNPLNPINAYDPANPFNPINRFDPGNPANPINRFNFNNRFKQVNGWVEWGPMAYGRWREHKDRQQVLGYPVDIRCGLYQFDAVNLT